MLLACLSIALRALNPKTEALNLFRSVFFLRGSVSGVELAIMLTLVP